MCMTCRHMPVSHIAHLPCLFPTQPALLQLLIIPCSVFLKHRSYRFCPPSACERGGACAHAQSSCATPALVPRTTHAALRRIPCISDMALTCLSPSINLLARRRAVLLPGGGAHHRGVWHPQLTAVLLVSEMASGPCCIWLLLHRSGHACSMAARPAASLGPSLLTAAVLPALPASTLPSHPIPMGLHEPLRCTP